MHYTDEGQGRPVLMLHGWCGRIESWGIIPSRMIEAGHRVIAVDFPGFGLSQPPETVWGVQEYGQAVYELVRSLNLDHIDIIAHSFGGRISLWLAHEHPELVGKMILTGCAGIKPKRRISYYFKVYHYKLLKWLSQLLPPKSRERLKAKFANAGSDDYRAVYGIMRGVFVKVVKQDLTPLLPNIKASTLLIFGENDTDTPPYMAKIMEKKMPDAGLVVFEGCGHFAYLEQCARFIKIATHFLKG